jgi:hypothetical protein
VFVELMIRLIAGGLAPYSQRVASLLKTLQLIKLAGKIIDQVG